MKFMKNMMSAVTAAVIGVTMTTAVTGAFTNASAASKTAVELVEDMGLGWNLGNALDSTNTWDSSLTPEKIETAWGNIVTTESMIKEVKKAGFNTVRIPVTWWDMTGKSGQANINNFDGTVADEYLARVKEVVDYCVKNDMYAIINTHHDEEWEKDTSKINTFKKLWNQLATYFKDYDEHLVFEGMNEVSFSTSDAMNYNQAFVDTVRATGGNNKDRLLICTADSNNTAKALSDAFKMPTDSSNMLAVSVHYYEPPQFCVADTTSSWGHRETWGTASDYSVLESDFNKLEKKFVDSGVGVVIGEYGVCNADKYGVNSTPYQKDQESIEKFLEAVASTAYGKTGICPVVWDDSDSGTISLFSRKKLAWFDENIRNIYTKIANGSSPDIGKEKTDRVSFDAADISAVDDKTKKTYLNVDLKPYKELGVNVSSVVVEYEMTSAKNSSEMSGNINMNFNIVDENGENVWAYLDNAIGPKETSTTFEMPIGKSDFVLEKDDDGNPTSVVTGTLDMDYLKFENWWTWSGVTGDTVKVDFKKVTVVFDGFFYVEGQGDNTGTTTTPAETTEAPQTTTTTQETPSGEQIGEAYFIGMIGGAENWKAGDDAGAAVTPIYGDGQYSISWDVTGGGTDTVQFLCGLISPVGESENFTTDTFEDLAVTIDEVWIDGVKLDYTPSANAVNTRYYEGEGPGVSRMYLHDDWSTKIKDLPSKTTITQEVKLVFTISGTGIGSGPVVTTTEEVVTTTTGETTVTTKETTTTTTEATTEQTTTKTTVDYGEVLFGDVNVDGKVELVDAILLNKACAGQVTLTDEANANADCNASGSVDTSDAIALLRFLVHLETALPVTE